MRKLSTVWAVLIFSAILFAVFASGTSWWLLMLTQAVVLGMATMMLGILPRQLAQHSRNNCNRMDGSFSPQRYARELIARQKFKQDVLATILLVAIGGNWAAFFVHRS